MFVCYLPLYISISSFSQAIFPLHSNFSRCLVITCAISVILFFNQKSKSNTNKQRLIAKQNQNIREIVNFTSSCIFGDFFDDKWVTFRVGEYG
jgi:hypothetical protein